VNAKGTTFQHLSLWALGITAVFIFSTDAQAYLDPGAGSYMLQVVLAGFFGALVAFRSFWAGMFARFRRTRHLEAPEKTLQGPRRSILLPFVTRMVLFFTTGEPYVAISLLKSRQSMTL